MRVLVIKTSSLGDVIHTLPALTDAARALPGIRFDWVVEEGFAEIPAWHPAVDRVIPVAIRRWRKAPLRTWLSGEWRRFTRELLASRHDATIDAQGLLKSALLTRYASTPVHGLDRDSAREPFASRFYTHRHAVARDRHAVERVRELFAKALGYAVPEGPGAYGLDLGRVFGATGPAVFSHCAANRPVADDATPSDENAKWKPDPFSSGDPEMADAEAHATATSNAFAAHRGYLIFLHGTTWTTKHWPEAYWRTLAELAGEAGWAVRLPWGTATEHERAERLAAGLSHVTVLPRLPLSGIAAELAGARACVAVDTGLGHLAAALDVPTVSLFGPTHPGHTGAWGPRQLHLASDFGCAPCLRKQCTYQPTPNDVARFDVARESPLCFTRVAPQRVWATLAPLLERS
jgi:heptosyltransferase-1